MEEYESVEIPAGPMRVVKWTPEGEEIVPDEKALANLEQASRRNRVAMRAHAEKIEALRSSLRDARRTDPSCCTWAEVFNEIAELSGHDLSEVDCCARCEIAGTIADMLDA